MTRAYTDFAMMNFKLEWAEGLNEDEVVRYFRAFDHAVNNAACYKRAAQEEPSEENRILEKFTMDFLQYVHRNKKNIENWMMRDWYPMLDSNMKPMIYVQRKYNENVYKYKKPPFE